MEARSGGICSLQSTLQIHYCLEYFSPQPVAAAGLPNLANGTWLERLHFMAMPNNWAFLVQNY